MKRKKKFTYLVNALSIMHVASVSYKRRHTAKVKRLLLLSLELLS